MNILPYNEYFTLNSREEKKSVHHVLITMFLENLTDAYLTWSTMKNLSVMP